MKHDPLDKKVMRLIADGCDHVYELDKSELALICMELIAEINKQRFTISNLKADLTEGNAIIRNLSEEIEKYESMLIQIEK